MQQVPDHVHVASHCSAHAAREAHHIPAPVADARDAVQRALDPRAVVTAKQADALLSSLQVLMRNLGNPAAASDPFLSPRSFVVLCLCLTQASISRWLKLGKPIGAS